MKARVISTGEIVEIVSCRMLPLPGGKMLHYKVTKEGDNYLESSLDFNYKNNPDYWTRLEHQAAIAAMQGILSNNQLYREICKSRNLEITIMEYAHTLVEKYKEKEERK